MKEQLLHDDIQKFIDLNIDTDISKLALTKNPFPESDWKEILNQIAAKSKSREKLPTWFSTAGIIYPQKLSIEQASSETTAKYKASLISGHNLIDLTGGFGVDDYFFAQSFAEVTHCEINPELSQVVRHNLKKLNVDNISCEVGDSSDILKKLDKKWNWIYVDPSRRHDSKGKVFLFSDCLPDVPELLEFYFTYSDNILIKTSPLLDISAGLSELRHVTAIHIVSVRNEVKEMLWEIRKNFEGHLRINTIDFGIETNAFGFEPGSDEIPNYAFPKKYLYEPNAAIMKSAGFDHAANAFKLDKLHKHSHLLTSDDLTENFPGRIFLVSQSLSYSKAEMKRLSLEGKANVTTRNFPLTVDEIRKKWKIADGGQRYLFFTTDKNDGKIVLICAKIK